MTYSRKVFLLFTVNSPDIAGATQYVDSQFKEVFLATYNIQTGALPFAGTIKAVSINSPNAITDTNVNMIILSNAVERIVATVLGVNSPQVLTQEGSIAVSAGIDVAMAFRDSAQAGNNSCVGCAIGEYT